MDNTPFRSLAKAVEEYYDELKAFVKKRTGSIVIAEDTIQETWLRAQSSDVQPNNPRAYLYRMASNLATDSIRAQTSRNTHEVEELSESGDELEYVKDESATPLHMAATQQEFERLSAAVNELPDRCKEVFILYRGYGLTMREIGEKLEISEKTVEKHIARAMLHCRKKLTEQGTY